MSAFGRNKDELVEFKLVIERENILAMPSLNVAVLLLITYITSPILMIFRPSCYF